jgi:hypothetical protein
MKAYNFDRAYIKFKSKPPAPAWFFSAVSIAKRLKIESVLITATPVDS